MKDRQRIRQESRSVDPTDSYRIPNWIICTVYLALALGTLIVYSQVQQFEFVNWDDDAFVHQNPHVTSGLTADNFRWSLGIHGPGQWHPIAWWVHQMNCQAFGVEPGAHHLVNVGLHIAVTLLLLTVFWKITGAFWPSALVAALHALHPLSVESIAWVSHLREPLSLMFWLLVMWAYFVYARRRGIARYVLVVILFAVGLMAKPTLITLPFVLLLMDWWPLNRVTLGNDMSVAGQQDIPHPHQPSLVRLVLEKVPLLVLALTSAYLAFLCQRSMDAVVSLQRHSLGARLANAVQSYVLYLRNMIWPMELTTLYPLPDGFSALYVSGALLLLVCITAVAFYFRRQAPHFLFGWFWYLGTLVPVIGILKMGEMTAMTDHYMYVSLLGIYIAIAWQLNSWIKQYPNLKSIVSGVVAVLLLAFASRTSQQIAVWRNSESLWKHAVSVESESSIAHNNLGDAIAHSNRIDEALKHYKEAVRIDPDFVPAHNNAGASLVFLGRLDEAITHYRTALRIAPENAEVHYNCGIAFQQQQRWEDAVMHYEEALRIRPQFAEAHTNSGVSLRSLGRTEEAIEHYEQAIAIDPSFVKAYNNLGVALESIGRKAEAIEQYEQALRVDPKNFQANYNGGVALMKAKRRSESLECFERAVKLRPKDGGTHYGLAWIMATAPEAELRDGQRAIFHARLAVQLIPGNAFMHDALAAAHAEAGEFSEAVKLAEQAIQNATGKNQIVFKARLERYKQQLPYRLAE